MTLSPAKTSPDKTKDMVMEMVEKHKMESVIIQQVFKDRDELEQVLGYEFKDKGLIERAFTHASCKNGGGSFKRLGHYGISVLNLMVARDQYFSYSELTSGKLTRLRSANVDNEKLCRVAARYNLDKYFLYQNDLLGTQIKELKKAMEEYPLHSNGLAPAPKVLAYLVESTIGAIFQDTDSSLDITWKVVKELLKPIITPETLETHPMTKFNEFCQKHGIKVKFEYKCIENKCKEKNYVVDVYVDNKSLASSSSKSSKSIAQNRAVYNAYGPLVKKMNVQMENNTKKDHSIELQTTIEEEEIEIPDLEKLHSLSEVEAIIDYKFKDRRLLERAFSHKTCNNNSSCSYERLEYLGDSVLNLLMTRHDYFSYPELQPDNLTRLLAVNVDTEKLARAAVKHNLYKYLCHKIPLLNEEINDFIKDVEEYPSYSNGHIVAPKVLADIVESIIGAIFLDTNSSLEITWKVCKKLLEPIITMKTLQIHPVTELYEYCQKHQLKLEEVVDSWIETGAVHFLVDNKVMGQGICKSNRNIATNRAATITYQHLTY